MTQLDTLAKFGAEFQTKCVVALMTDRDFLEQSLDIINPAFFESEANAWIVEKILWYFETYKELPTASVLAKEIIKMGTDTRVQSLKDHLKDVWKNLDSTDLQYIKDELLNFCKNQAIKNAVLKSADLVQSGRYDEIKVIYDKALHSGMPRDLGHNYAEELTARISHAARNTVATRWNIINHILDGGLGAGELGCVIAPSGGGKSWFLQNLGQYAISQGKTVVHFTVGDLSETYTGLRYDCITTGIEPQKIKDHPVKVQEEISKLPGKLFIKYYPTRSATVNVLRAFINRMTQMGHKPDMVIVDYADLLLNIRKSDSKWEGLEYIYEELRGMLGELQIPGWTASQSQRSALQDEVIEADKIAGAYAKVMVCDVVFSSSRKQADKINNTARIYCIKNRFGPDGGIYPARMNFSTGEMGVFDENSIEGKKIKQEAMGGEQAMKKQLHDKLLDLKSKKNIEPEEIDLG